MKTAKLHASKETRYLHAAFLAGLPWSNLDAWHPRSRRAVPGAPVPLTTEEHYRMIELAAKHQSDRRRVTPEFDLRDWLDAEQEIKSH